MPTRPADRRQEDAPPPEQTDAPAHEAPDPNRWFILVGLVMSVIMETLDTTIINAALPQMGGNLGVTPQRDRLGFYGIYPRSRDRAAVYRRVVLLAVQTQARTLAYNNAFLMIGVVFVFVFPAFLCFLPCSCSKNPPPALPHPAAQCSSGQGLGASPAHDKSPTVPSLRPTARWGGPAAR